MAKVYPAARKTGEPDPELKMVQRMIASAETDRNRHLVRIEDCYRYGLPWRHKSNDSQPQDQLDEIFDEELMTVLEDFAADMLNTFTPQKSEWVEPKPVETLDTGEMRQIETQLARLKKVVFAEMARSNLYVALQEAYLDLGPGTMAMIVLDLDVAQPIHCEAIPAVDLLLNRGPHGKLKGIWRTRKRTGDEVQAMWPDARRRNGGEWKDDGLPQHVVVDGVYRDLKEKADETWHYVVVCDSEIIFRETYKGKGSNPFIVARWSGDAMTAWGIGPTYRTLPAIKTLNHFRFTLLKNFDKEADPVVSYEDDGVMNVDGGVEPGKWYPRAPGSKAPEAIESQSRMDVASFNIDEVRTAIRRAHYQDRPQQQGKTPPTATQWADEAAERARRMGSPATKLVVELQYPLFERFVYLLTKRGKLPKIRLNDQTIALEPISPLLRAQEQEEVVRMDKFCEMIIGRFGPDMGNVVINTFKYAEKLRRKMGVDPEVVRGEGEISQTINQLGPVLGGGGGAAGEPPVPPAAGGV